MSDKNIIGNKPGKKKTMDHQYPIRIDEELWRQAKSKAALEGFTLREILKNLLQVWVNEKVEFPRKANGKRVNGR